MVLPTYVVAPNKAAPQAVSALRDRARLLAFLGPGIELLGTHLHRQVCAGYLSVKGKNFSGLGKNRSLGFVSWVYL